MEKKSFAIVAMVISLALPIAYSVKAMAAEDDLGDQSVQMLSTDDSMQKQNDNGSDAAQGDANIGSLGNEDGGPDAAAGDDDY